MLVRAILTQEIDDLIDLSSIDVIPNRETSVEMVRTVVLPFNNVPPVSSPTTLCALITAALQRNGSNQECGKFFDSPPDDGIATTSMSEREVLVREYSISIRRQSRVVDNGRRSRSNDWDDWWGSHRPP
ncbi:hypothetical protein R1flu_022015 [Riccia fluitans]|uniref:Uncharacterized protein n=1 Tax=Riccia fluitans TaxID=41844 RepID=A0ABD1ZS58_9MARC